MREPFPVTGVGLRVHAPQATEVAPDRLARRRRTLLKQGEDLQEPELAQALYIPLWIWIAWFLRHLGQKLTRVTPCPMCLVLRQVFSKPHFEHFFREETDTPS